MSPSFLLGVVLMPQEEVIKKVQIMGDGFCGKSWLIRLLATGECPLPGDASALESGQTFVTEANINGQNIHLSMLDVLGCDDSRTLATYYMTLADVVVLSFGLSNDITWDNLKEVHYQTYLEKAPEIPAMIVGLKSDLKGIAEYDGNVPVLEGEGLAFAQSAGLEYYECSAKTGEGIDQLLEAIARASLKPKKVSPKQSRRSRIGAKLSSFLKST